MNAQFARFIKACINPLTVRRSRSNMDCMLELRGKAGDDWV